MGSAPPTLLGPHILSGAACGVLGFWVVLMTDCQLMLHCGEHHSSFEGSAPQSGVESYDSSLEGSTPQSGVESLVGAPLDSDLSSTLFLSRTWLMRRSQDYFVIPSSHHLFLFLR